jgi:hypothetical protein
VGKWNNQGPKERCLFCNRDVGIYEDDGTYYLKKHHTSGRACKGSRRPLAAPLQEKHRGVD